MNRTEIARALDKGQYEQTEAGILLRQSRMLVSGEYRHWVNDKDERVDKNLVVDEGIRHLLDVNFNGKTVTPTWYLSIYRNAYTPTPELDAATYATTTDEVGDLGPTPPGYSPGTRPEFVEAAAPMTPIGAPYITNMANKAVFTISGTTLVINGAGLHSSNVKRGAGGVLMSATRFTAPRTLYGGDVFTLAYTVTLTSA